MDFDHERIHQMAIYWVQHWAWRQDCSLVDDCRSAAYLRACEIGLKHPKFWYKLEDAMKDEIRRWLNDGKLHHGSRDFKPHKITPPLSWTKRMALRVAIKQLWKDAERGYQQPVKYREVWLAMVENGGPNNIPRAIQRKFGIKSRAVYNGKRWLRRRAHELLGD